MIYYGVVWRRIRAQTCWTTWPQPILCLSVIQWHAGKEGSQPEKDTTEEQYIMSGMTSVVDSDGRARVFYSGVGLGRRHIGPPGLSQSCVSLQSNGMREWKAVNQRRTRLRSSI
uniref:Secreted protein n=1 Tax=Mesocestoides corti TaxID=53468 RepID=A0A5K3G2F8_MESCO